MTVGFHIKSNIPQFTSSVREQVQNALGETVVTAATKAMVLAPKDTGFLANTIQAQTPVQEGEMIVARFGNWTASYALWVEIGTSRMAAQPYLTPAAMEEFPKMAQRLRKMVGGGRLRMPRLASRLPR